MYFEVLNCFYVLCGDGFMGGFDCVYFESYNNGNSWILCSEGFEYYYLYSMIIDLVDCNMIFVLVVLSVDLVYYCIFYEFYIYWKMKDILF